MAEQPEPERMETIIRALRKSWTKMACTACASNQWDVGGEVYLPDFTKTGVNLTRGVPAVVVACKTCGHLMFFASNVLGISEEKKL